MAIVYKWIRILIIVFLSCSGFLLLARTGLNWLSIIVIFLSLGLYVEFNPVRWILFVFVFFYALSVPMWVYGYFDIKPMFPENPGLRIYALFGIWSILLSIVLSFRNKFEKIDLKHFLTNKLKGAIALIGLIPLGLIIYEIGALT